LQIGQFNLTRAQTGSVNIDVVTQTSLPFVSMGYEKKIKKSRLSIITEAGFYNHGLPLISMSSTGVFRLNDRNKDQIQENISSLRYYPLLNVALGYKL
jgi:non-ribosomal peptide synthetase component E (peptide arylation enzyme)